MEKINNHVINDRPLREATVVLQSILLHIEQSNNVYGTILSECKEYLETFLYN